MSETVKGGSLRKGMYIDFKNDPCQIIKTDFMSPGKGSAFMRVKLRNLRTGGTQEFTYKSTESVEILDIQSKQMQFLYRDGDQAVFMDPRSYEQVSLDVELLEDKLELLTSEIQIYILFHGETAIDVSLPPKVRLKVEHAEHAVAGDTVGGAKKNVTLETGLVIQAPLFVQTGDVLVIDTATKTYVSRGN